MIVLVFPLVLDKERRKTLSVSPLRWKVRNTVEPCNGKLDLASPFAYNLQAYGTDLGRFS